MERIPVSELRKVIEAHPEAIHPLGNYLLVDLYRPDEKTPGGVVLPDEARERDRPMLGRVLAVGPGQRSILNGEHMPMHVRVGDYVIVNRHGPMELKLAEKTYYFVFEGDVLAVLGPEIGGEIEVLIAKHNGQET